MRVEDMTDYQSHHFGIETAQLAQQELPAQVYQSHHFGIETGFEAVLFGLVGPINRTILELKPNT